MQGRCEKHPFEMAEDRCGTCGRELCPECLVYSFGAERPPFCIPCAVSAAGIRRGARAPRAMPRRELKRMEKERLAAFKAIRRGAKDAPAPVDVSTSIEIPGTELIPSTLAS